MTDDYTVGRWGPEPAPIPHWLADKVSRLGEVSERVLFGLPLDAAGPLFKATVPPPPEPGEIMATIRKYLDRNPTHTLIVSEAHADRARRAVGDAFLALDVEVVPSPFVAEGQAYLIKHAAFENEWKLRPPSPGACCDLHGRNCEQGGEECCGDCTEAHHFDIRHGGMPCSNPELSKESA